MAVTRAERDLGQLQSSASQRAAGLRFGAKGTHTSRTIMLAELTDLFRAVPPEAGRSEYEIAIIEGNALGKDTTATRRLTFQRLRELYALDARVPVFRVLQRLWPGDAPGRPLLAMLCALARDPLLRVVAPSVLALPVGSELVRAILLDSLREVVGDRLNPSVLDKVARNVASSWCQSGHLKGRVRKMRTKVVATPGAAAFAMWLGTVEGLGGRALLESPWARVLVVTGEALLPLVLQAKQFGLLHARVGGGVVEIDAGYLDPAMRR